MKKIIMAVLVGVLSAESAYAGIKDYKLSLPTKLNTYTVGARDLRYGEWLAGYSAEILWLRRKDEDKAIVYLAANHLFNYDRAGKGAVGGAIGVNTGKAGETIVKAAGILLPEQSSRLKWLQSVANYISIEGGGGYKIWGVPQGQSNWFYTLGGKVKIPLGEFWSWVKK